MNEKLAWYVSRSSGWVAFFLLAITVAWGILGITKIIERRGLPRWMIDLHKYVALLTVIFTAVHLGGLVADNYTHIAWREIVVPYAFDWKPGAVTFGIVAMYLLVVVQVSSWLRPRLPRKVWKSAHMLSYPAMWLVAMHGLKAGTDSSNVVLRVAVMAAVSVTSLFTLLRIFMGRTARRITVQRVIFEPLAEVEVEVEAVSSVAIVESDDYVTHVQQAMDSLRDALQRMHEAVPASDPVPVERRHEARTLVDDVSPQS